MGPQRPLDQAALADALGRAASRVSAGSWAARRAPQVG